jgi:hypothetical protein
MYSHSYIEEDFSSGALTADQANSLRNFVARRNGTPTADEEHVRWLLGFGDLYIYFSSILLMFGLGWLGSKIEVGSGPSFFIPLLIGLAAWGLSEYFVRRKHLAMTAITLATVFVYCVYFTIMLLAVQLIGQNGDRATGQLVSAIAAVLAAGGAFLHWKRFAVPIAYSLILGALAVAIMSLLGAIIPNDPEGTVAFLVLTLIGVATLVYAQTWEAKDIHRTTKTADIAFWLHWTAAFEVVFGLVGLLGLQGYPSTGAAIGGIVVFLVLALVGIVLDRRVWVLLGAWPLGVGIHTLLKGSTPAYNPYGTYGEFEGSSMGYSPYRSMSDTVDNVMLTLLILGVVLIVIGMFWTQIRRALGGLGAPLAGKIPPTNPVQSEGQTFE